MALFTTSTQAHHWLFSESQLADLRARAVDAGPSGTGKLDASDGSPHPTHALPPVAQTPAHSRTPHTFMTPGFGGLSLQTPVNPPRTLSIEDQQTLVRYSICRIPAVCAQLQLPLRVEATAMTYVQRFYLKHSVREHAIKDVILGAIFLAGKIEDAKVVSTEQFALSVGMYEDTLKEKEVALLYAMEFNLIVFHPFRSLRGLLSELGGVPQDTLTRLGSVADQMVRDSLATDACFRYTPGHLACAAVAQACSKLGVSEIDVGQMVRERHGHDSATSVEAARLEYFEGIMSCEETSEKLAREASRIDRLIKRPPIAVTITAPTPTSSPLGPPAAVSTGRRRRLDIEGEGEGDRSAKRSRK